MSGRPNIEQINQLRGHVQKLAMAKQDCMECRRQIRLYTDSLKLNEETHAECQRQIIKLMDEMDVSSRGNFGWENRFMTFIAELVCPLPGVSEPES